MATKQSEIIERVGKGAALLLALGMLLFAVMHGQGCGQDGAESAGEVMAEPPQVSEPAGDEALAGESETSGEETAEEGQEEAALETEDPEAGTEPAGRNGAEARGTPTMRQGRNRTPMNVYLPATKSGSLLLDVPQAEELPHE